MRKIIATVFVAAILIGLWGCGKEPALEPQTKESDFATSGSNFTAKVTEVHESYFLLEVTDSGNSGISVGNVVTLSGKRFEEETARNIMEGSRVQIVFDGAVMEIYPLQLGAITSVTILGGEEDKTPESEADAKIEEKFEAEASLKSGQEQEMPMNGESDWGITLTAKEVTPTGLTLIVTQSDGEPTGRLQYGSDYQLEILEDGVWRAVPYIIDNAAWTSEAYMVALNADAELKISWEVFHGELQPGTYRISKSFMDFRETGDYDTQSFYAEFEIE